MDLAFVTDVIITILILPLQVVLLPIDALLAQIPGIGIVASSITQLTSFIGTIPETLVNLTGIAPLLWNVFFLTFILWLTATPTINMLKKVWAWVRP